MSAIAKTEENQQLSEMQKSFVSIYLGNGFDAEAAARAVGSKDPAQYARTTFRAPAVQAAIQAATKGEMASASLEALGAVLSIIRNPDPDPKWARLRLDAAKTVWDRVGVVHVSGNEGRKQAGALADMTDEELQEMLAKMKAGDGARVINGDATASDE